jgi:hypothetical protein
LNELRMHLTRPLAPQMALTLAPHKGLADIEAEAFQRGDLIPEPLM